MEVTHDQPSGENSSFKPRGAEALRKANFHPKFHPQHGGKRWDIIATALITSAIVAPVAFLAGARFSASATQVDNSPNFIGIIAECATSDPKDPLSPKEVILSYDQSHYRPFPTGGIVLEIIAKQGPSGFHHIPSNLVENDTSSNFIIESDLRALRGVSLILYHEKNLINTYDPSEKYQAVPSDELLETLGGREIPEDFCGNP